MVENILNIILAIVAFVLFGCWVAALAKSDGHCHHEDCTYCPYDGDCPEQERKAADERHI